VVIDSADAPLAEGLEDDPVELLCRLHVQAERLLLDCLCGKLLAVEKQLYEIENDDGHDVGRNSNVVYDTVSTAMGEIFFILDSMVSNVALSS